ncbi:MAG: cytochrome c peroxidase [Limisphaerales bacterium]|nr:MAG: cytochrome c peroxidase [Limisphaerales bacterium]KAG0509676.1 MAG: cytochrome c peroxidase [Limisphaerales bacterium]TXT51205.1 MAG: cytochrome c peroxidase [Limisphaerales bacterium]
MQPTRFPALAVVGLWLWASAGEGASPASLGIAPGPGTNFVSVRITDPGNHVWVLQSSTNLTNWAEVAALKLHNGSFRHGIPPAAPPNVLFRAVYDPARQTIPSAVTNALLLPATPFKYASPALPPGFSQQPILGQDTMPATNVTTDAGATLGRVLFYDKRLSTNQTVACASCHVQANGFSDPRRFSVGFNGGLTGRNSMGLSNARWYQRQKFFWDERAATLEDQTLRPIQDALEMGMTLPALTNRLAAEPFYTNLFTQTFGTPEVTSERVSQALAQFVRSIVSVQSKYDAALAAGNNFASLTTQENLGRQIFFGQGTFAHVTCARCHGTDNFVPGAAINNNGLENPYVDKGLGALTGLPQDEGLFKVPSLRNIELTAPYMHDGRFATLEQVVNFYNQEVVQHPNLSPPLQGTGGASGTPLRLGLTPQQQAALVAFMKTLTDTNLATDPKLSDPFNYGN